MKKDILFLLPPGFEDNGRREYCPECAEIWGVLAYFPAIREALEIRYQPIARPRAEMTAMLGDAHQNCPTLVLASPDGEIGDASTKTAGDRVFADNAGDIGKIFAARYGTPLPRGR
ncbi:MAG: DUF3088 family protein [Pseudomonadota bacterium]